MGTLGSPGGGGKPGEGVWLVETMELPWRLPQEEEPWTMAGEVAEGGLGMEKWEEHGLWEQEPPTTCDLGLLNPSGLHFFL